MSKKEKERRRKNERENRERYSEKVTLKVIESLTRAERMHVSFGKSTKGTNLSERETVDRG